MEHHLTQPLRVERRVVEEAESRRANGGRTSIARRAVAVALSSACIAGAQVPSPTVAVTGHPPAGTIHGAPPTVDRDGDGLSDLTELGLAALRRPELAPLTTGLARRKTEPVRLLFLGSSTTYGVGASSRRARYVNQLVSNLQRSFPSGTGREAATRHISTSAEHPDGDAGVQGIVGAVGGATAATYFTEAHEWGVQVLQPTCVVHMVGSNDSIAEVPLPTYEAQVRGAIRRIDARSTRPPCHVLAHSVRRYQVSSSSWALYGEALRRIAGSRTRVTFVDLSGAFESRDAPGSDPEDLIGADGVHLTDAGHALLADLLRQALDITRGDLGTGTSPRRADTDEDGLRDGAELTGYVIAQRIMRCSRPVVMHTRARSVPYVPDTDGDSLVDGLEVRGFRLQNGSVVRTHPAVADTDMDGRSDSREALVRHTDPTWCNRPFSSSGRLPVHRRVADR